MKYLPLLLCLALFACDPVADDENGSVSSGGSVSSNSGRNWCAYPVFSKDTLHFNKYGGTDTVVISTHSNEHSDTAALVNSIPWFYRSEDDEGCKLVMKFGSIWPKVECSWYSIANINLFSMQISVNENKTGEERITSRNFFAGDCGWNSFWVIQSAGRE